MLVDKSMNGAWWAWDLANRVNECAELKESLIVFLGGLSEQYNPEMAGIWLAEDDAWTEVSWQGERTERLELQIVDVLKQWVGKGKDSFGSFPEPEGELFCFPLYQRRSHVLLGACVTLIPRERSVAEREGMADWIGHFSWLLALHIEREQEHCRFFRQQVAFNLLLGGSNILNNVKNEPQLFTEAGEMAMGILHVDKGVFLVRDDLDAERMWLRGFGRLKDIQFYAERKELSKRKGSFCGLEPVTNVRDCHDCPYFEDICKKGLGDLPQGMMFSKYPLLINGEAVGELRLLHLRHELDTLDQETLNTFVLQISLALETLRHRSTLERLATHDPLTGLLNRTGLEERLEAECARAGRAEEKFLFIVLDLDYFKQVNDTLGHPAGDQLLIKLGAVLSNSVRPYDLVSRIGGDEFVVVFTRWEETQTNYDRIRTWLAEVEQALPDVGVHIGLSAGATRFPENEDFRSLYQKADEALYQAKQQGRHRICGLD
ncbi:MAG: GGDEF domain-containing protein [Desulfitobacteriaceae bacterium]